MKFIDAERLKKEIEQLKQPFKKDIENGVYPTYLCALLDFEELINSLQQEVDLKDKIKEYFKGWTETDEGIACHYQHVDLNTCHNIARHFFELGINARKEKGMTKEEIIQNVKTRISAIESYRPEESVLNKGLLFELKDLLSMIEE